MDERVPITLESGEIRKGAHLGVVIVIVIVVVHVLVILVDPTSIAPTPRLLEICTVKHVVLPTTLPILYPRLNRI